MIAIGSDHGGFELKKEIIAYLEKNNLEYKDYGTYTPDSCDYPVYAKKVANAILEGEWDLSLDYWKKVHEEFFKTQKKNFTIEDKIIFEEIEVTKNLVEERLKIG